ncbi:MAG: AAA family ATPase [Methanoregula sp.]|nr:AAA family ATPase [Methanoregula sp.]
MRTIVTMGRGGTGKTTFVALMARYLIETNHTPILLVDADPDQNLAEMVGLDLEAAGKKTISELLSETFIQKGGTTVGVPPSQRIENRIWEQGLFESEAFDLLAVGTKWIEGCYCLPDAALKNALGSITRQYQYVLIDSPAGLEHLNRKIAGTVDTIVDVMGPSSKSFYHVKRAHRIVREVGIRYGQFVVIGGYAFPRHLEARAKTETGLAYLGKITEDPVVAEYVLSGHSLLHIPDTSPAFLSVGEIVERIIHA